MQTTNQKNYLFPLSQSLFWRPSADQKARDSGYEIARHATLLPTNGCSHSNNIPFPLFCCGLMKGPIMYQQSENDVSFRAKKDKGDFRHIVQLLIFITFFLWRTKPKHRKKLWSKAQRFRVFFTLRY